MNREIKRRSRVVQVFPSVESVLRLVGAVCAERDEDWSSRRYISPESMRRLSEPAEPDHAESEGSRKRGLMVVETAMELAGGGRRAAQCCDAGGFGWRPVPGRRATPTFPTLPVARPRKTGYANYSDATPRGVRGRPWFRLRHEHFPRANRGGRPEAGGERVFPVCDVSGCECQRSVQRSHRYVGASCTLGIRLLPARTEARRRGP